MRTKFRFGAVVALGLCGWLGGVCEPASASSITYTTVAGSDADGPVAATLQFTAVNGGLEITATNTLVTTAADPLKRGEAISAMSFTLSGLSNVTAFTKLTGSTVDSSTFTPNAAYPGASTVTPFSDTGTTLIDHWSFAATGGSVHLATAGGTATGNPTYMILPATGYSGPSKSLDDGHFDPYILGPGEFFLSVAGVTSSTVLSASNFRNVTLGFGTGPDTTPFITTTTPNIVTPEPASVTILASSLFAFGGLGLVRRRRGTPRTTPTC
jgi:hypothetical protein